MLKSRKDRSDEYYLYNKGLKLFLRNHRALQDRPPLQMRMITYNVKVVPWSRSSHLIGTRLFPSSDDSDNNFSGTLGLR
jgi:hypothetical protein